MFPGTFAMLGPVMQPRLALLASTALSATYPVTLKLIYAADGAALSPASITSLRFALMAGGAALVLSESSSPAASEPQGEPLSKPLYTPLAEPPNESAAFWRAAAELGFWACAGPAHHRGYADRNPNPKPHLTITLT